LSTYLKECKSTYKTDACTPVFTGAMFTIAKVKNLPRCPTTDEQNENVG
jgi:hypothetical protein